MMCEQVLSQWLSKVILKACNEESKLTYRKFEKLKIRITNERFHLQFNLACINIYIYIYVCVCVYHELIVHKPKINPNATICPQPYTWNKKLETH